MASYTYGPVPSRRLGRSLGVDLVPLKTCDLNCIYCQLGPTETTTLERADYAPLADVLAELRRRLSDGPPADYVTLAGSGEPTLHLHFGEAARQVKQFSDVPVALLTNGTLFYLPEVRADCADVDLVLPSLDAGDEETFRRMNRPHRELSFARVMDGLVALREEFRGQIWLEVFVVEGVNSSDEQVARIAECIERIRPERVQVNTAVRPPAEADVQRPSPSRMDAIRAMLGPNAELIVPGAEFVATPGAEARKEEVLGMLQRRPCTLRDIADGLGILPNEAVKHVQRLLDERSVEVRQRLYDTYYEATQPEQD